METYKYHERDKNSEEGNLHGPESYENSEDPNTSCVFS